MSYQVIARKWRPQLFGEVVGQSHITTTLRHAVERDRVGHAYLFAGPRGVGKTTTARLLAKALNCIEGPTPDPCNSCEHCRAIAAGADVDVIEIDAASNRGIDEIRSLRENVKFAPAASRYKVYIIDEVHMLTREAFNALLKTLEEPPAHALFILATTDPDRLPPTILSRCQLLTFRRIPTPEIAELLRRIAAEEGYELEGEAALLVARSAGGAIRDAESALEQLFAYAEGGISADDARAVLGKVNLEELAALTGEVQAGDAAAVVARCGSIVDSGVDPRVLAEELLAYWRDCFLFSLGGESAKTAELADAEVAAALETEAWLALLSSLRRTLVELKASRQPRLVLELALVELSQLPRLIPVAELARRLAAGAPAPQPADVKKKPLDAEEAAPPEPRPAADEPPAALEPFDGREFLRRIKRRNATLGALCAGAAELELLDDDVVRLRFAPRNAFHQRGLRKLENVRLFEDVTAELYGRRLTPESVLDDALGGDDDAPEPPAGRGDADIAGLPAAERRAVETVQDYFDARLIRIDKKG
jgi:DNA polymerase-3 subunit gamma/tau